ncbi:MAG: zinc-ribbon domain-containing protein [Sedimentisphaerales bacterium]|nr:zinc-ribbon domain-containing protein [Sedimentisphaerales bacterium]
MEPSPTEKIHFKCSVCGKSFGVSAKYAGKRGKCPGCGQIITIPALEEPSDKSLQLKSAEQPHSEQKETDTQTETNPKTDTKAEIEIKKPPQVRISKTVANVYRMGNTMVMQRNARLPDRCVKTNSTENLQVKRITLRWHNPLLYLTILAGLLVYVIVALVCTKKATIEVPMSRKILTRRLIFVLATWACVFLGIFGFGYVIIVSDSASYSNNNDLIILFSILMFIAAPIVYLIGGRIITASQIDDYYIWVKGVNWEYLSEFPQWQGHNVYVPAGTIPTGVPVAGKKCNQCGTNVSDTDKFCGRCGANLA